MLRNLAARVAAVLAALARALADVLEAWASPRPDPGDARADWVARVQAKAPWLLEPPRAEAWPQSSLPRPPHRARPAPVTPAQEDEAAEPGSPAPEPSREATGTRLPSRPRRTLRSGRSGALTPEGDGPFRPRDAARRAPTPRIEQPRVIREIVREVVEVVRRRDHTVSSSGAAPTRRDAARAAGSTDEAAPGPEGVDPATAATRQPTESRGPRGETDTSIAPHAPVRRGDTHTDGNRPTVTGPSHGPESPWPELPGTRPGGSSETFAERGGPRRAAAAGGGSDDVYEGAWPDLPEQRDDAPVAAELLEDRDHRTRLDAELRRL